MPDQTALAEMITLLFALKDAKGDNDLRDSIINALFEEIRMIDPDLLARMMTARVAEQDRTLKRLHKQFQQHRA